MAWNIFRRDQGSAPAGWAPVSYHEDQPLHTYQNKWTWPWPHAPAHETRAALTNNWTGNQLPGLTNFIPNVPASVGVWNVPTSYSNTLRNQQYNVGLNTSGMSSMQSASLMTMIQQAWQNRATG